MANESVELFDTRLLACFNQLQQKPYPYDCGNDHPGDVLKTFQAQIRLERQRKHLRLQEQREAERKAIASAGTNVVPHSLQSLFTGEIDEMRRQNQHLQSEPPTPALASEAEILAERAERQRSHEQRRNMILGSNKGMKKKDVLQPKDKSGKRRRSFGGLSFPRAKSFTGSDSATERSSRSEGEGEGTLSQLKRTINLSWGRHKAQAMLASQHASPHKASEQEEAVVAKRKERSRTLPLGKRGDSIKRMLAKDRRKLSITRKENSLNRSHTDLTSENTKGEFKTGRSQSSNTEHTRPEWVCHAFWAPEPHSGT